MPKLKCRSFKISCCRPWQHCMLIHPQCKIYMILTRASSNWKKRENKTINYINNGNRMEWSKIRGQSRKYGISWPEQFFFFLFHTLQHTQDLSTQSYNWNKVPVSTSNLLADYAWKDKEWQLKQSLILITRR